MPWGGFCQPVSAAAVSLIFLKGFNPQFPVPRKRCWFAQMKSKKHLMKQNYIFSFLLKLPAPLVIAAIWFLSSQSTLPQIKGIFGIDKLQHMLAFAILAAAAALWFPLGLWHRRGILIMLAIVAIASVYGGIDEYHQSFVPGRNSSIWDWLADTLGALIGAGAAMGIARKLKTA
jgi:VanZ family protein